MDGWVLEGCVHGARGQTKEGKGIEEGRWRWRRGQVEHGHKKGCSRGITAQMGTDHRRHTTGYQTSPTVFAPGAANMLLLLCSESKGGREEEGEYGADSSSRKQRDVSRAPATWRGVKNADAHAVEGGQQTREGGDGYRMGIQQGFRHRRESEVV
ncbi:hypothetical protein B0H17DRAFT_1134572 [Mycena rosella]|uniref:Uncharacterized protein n=1 Tax=Mycena rosella TaxID=1033263 RepID=A0AAD7DEY2_MYCRO|nr:hypothetical protein B0H17DRAFT_1134572 [Mycena rosella]